VKEAIQFSALNRLPEEVPYEEKMNFVEQILDDLELRVIENRIIGSGLSVEQKKRLNLAVELASNPQLIFLDEPTSGLDSVGARVVMNVVKKLSMQGSSIICTIHQPSAEIFKLFDSLLLLGNGGQVVYFGDIGNKGDKVMQYTNTLGYYMQDGGILQILSWSFLKLTLVEMTKKRPLWQKRSRVRIAKRGYLLPRSVTPGLRPWANSSQFTESLAFMIAPCKSSKIRNLSLPILILPNCLENMRRLSPRS